MTRRAFDPVKPCDPGLPKSAVRRLFDQLGGVKLAAVKLGLSVSQTYAFADPGVDDELSFARVVAITSPAAPACAEYVAQFAGGVFLPIAARSDDIPELTAEALREHGEACARLVAALKDGKITDRERPEALRELDEAIRAAVQLRTAVASEGRADAPPTG